MKLVKIDLKNLVAVGHEEGLLGLLIKRGNKMEYLEISAANTAYRSIQKIADIATQEPQETRLDGDILMLPVNSTMASAIGYDRERQILQIEFLNGLSYQYYNVELETWKRLLLSNSKGKFFNRKIKGCYPSQRVDNGEFAYQS